MADIRDGFVAHLVVVQIERYELAEPFGDRPGIRIANLVEAQIKRGELAEMLGDCGGVRVLQAQRPEDEDLQPVESQQLARQAEQAGQVTGQLIQNPALKLLGQSSGDVESGISGPSSARSVVRAASSCVSRSGSSFGAMGCSLDSPIRSPTLASRVGIQCRFERSEN